MSNIGASLLINNVLASLSYVYNRITACLLIRGVLVLFFVQHFRIFAACCENTFFGHMLSCLKSDTYLEGIFPIFIFGEMNAVFRPQNTNTPPISPQTIKI